MAAATPTARSMLELRKHGWLVTKVEQRIPFHHGEKGGMGAVLRDAFGFGDILACHPIEGIILIQATSRPNVNARITKAAATDIVGVSKTAPAALGPNPVRLNLLTWLKSGGKFEVWGWDKEKATKRWRYRRVRFWPDPTAGMTWAEWPMLESK